MHASTALKEWGAQVRALETGRTALIVRKGGIVERNGDFEVEHTRFWLYPTFLHQNPGELRSEFSTLLREGPRPGHLEIRAFAEVERVWQLTDLDLVRSLEPHQCLTAGALERRFKYRDKPWVHALLLRVHTLEHPVCLKETPSYAGCVSWVPLERELSVDDLKPVLEDAAFEAQQGTLETLLG
jgi:hypothetical protein